MYGFEEANRCSGFAVVVEQISECITVSTEDETIFPHRPSSAKEKHTSREAALQDLPAQLQRRVWPPKPCLRYHVLLRRQPFRQWITKILCTNAKFMVPLLSPPSTSNLHSRTYNPTTAGSKYADRPLSICSTPPWTAYFYACSPEQRRGQASATRCRSVIVDL